MKWLRTRFTIITVLSLMLICFNLSVAAKAPVARVGSRIEQDNTNFLFDIIAGRHIPVGNLRVWVEQNYIYVRYMTFDNWYLTETHLHLAMDWRQIPQTRTGNPIPGRFAYQGAHNYLNEYTYQIPLNDFKGIPRYGAAHCIVVKIENGKPVQEETGWTRNKLPPYGEFPGRNWAWYFEMRN